MDGVHGLEYLECGPAVATDGCSTSLFTPYGLSHHEHNAEDTQANATEEQIEAAAALNREIEEEIRRLNCTEADLDGDTTAETSLEDTADAQRATQEAPAPEDPPQLNESDLDQGVEQSVCEAEIPAPQPGAEKGRVVEDGGPKNWADPGQERTGCIAEEGRPAGDTQMSETWEILLTIEGMIRKAIDLPRGVQLTECKPDVLGRIPRDLLEALEEALAVLSYQQTVLEKQRQHSSTESDDGFSIRAPSRLHQGVKDLEMWAIKNKYLTHVAPSFMPGVLPPENLSPSSRQCGYPVPKVYLYQRLEQQAKFSQAQARRSAVKTHNRKPSENPKQQHLPASQTRHCKPAVPFPLDFFPAASMAALDRSCGKDVAGKGKDCRDREGSEQGEKRCTGESRMSLRQRQQVCRNLHLQSDLEFIGRSRERSKQSLDKHKQVSEKSQESIDCLRHQTRHLRVQREWARFQAMMLEKTRVHRALKASKDSSVER